MRADQHHPEEQGLKLAAMPRVARASRADQHHPEEQGLKQQLLEHGRRQDGGRISIIQKNKD